MTVRQLCCAATLTLAAATTLSAQARPLFVVDGVVVNQGCESFGYRNMLGLVGLNPANVDAIQIYKDASAVPQYGPAAANGAVIVKTKAHNYCLDTAAPPADALSQFFFPPDRIMAHQQEIGLQDAQRIAIERELQQSASNFVQLQFKMSAESEQLQKLVEAPVVNEAAVLAEVDRVLAAEREIKRAQISLLVRTKNVLTPQQQAKLTELRKAGR